MKCVTCTEEAIHTLGYGHHNNGTNWLGNYCNKCFILKLRGMAKVWSKRK